MAGILSPNFYWRVFHTAGDPGSVVAEDRMAGICLPNVRWLVFCTGGGRGSVAGELRLSDVLDFSFSRKNRLNVKSIGQKKEEKKCCMPLSIQVKVPRQLEV